MIKFVLAFIVISLWFMVGLVVWDSLVAEFAPCVWLLVVLEVFGWCVALRFCGLFTVFLWFRCWVCCLSSGLWVASGCCCW